MTPCIVVVQYGSSENPAAATFRMYEDGGKFFLKRLHLPTSLLAIASQKTSGLYFLRIRYSVNQFNEYENFKF
jgi:hypothetical protein